MTPATTRIERCCQCRFYEERLQPPAEGRCKRMPPPWPYVRHYDWCGEFKWPKAGE